MSVRVTLPTAAVTIRPVSRLGLDLLDLAQRRVVERGDHDLVEEVLRAQQLHHGRREPGSGTLYLSSTLMRNLPRA